MASAALRLRSSVLALSTTGWTAYGHTRTQQLRKSGNRTPYGVAEFMTETLFFVAIVLLGERVSGFYTFTVFLQLAFPGYFFFQLGWSLSPEA